MSNPIVFISHFRIKAGKLDPYRALTEEVTAALKAAKPRTLVFLSYLDAARTRVSILHAFADAESMDAHFEGIAERSSATTEFIEPVGWEFYGSPSRDVMAYVERAAEQAGVTLTVWPEHVAGFLRLAPG